MSVQEVHHPLIAHKLGLLRAQDTPAKTFRELARELASLLTYEATRDFPLVPRSIDCWSGPLEVQRLVGAEITVVPVLRAGLGMLDGVLQLIPNAHVSVVGLSRDEETLAAHSYVAKLAPGIAQQRALIVDPMLATGGSLIATIDLLKAAGCQDIRALVLVAAPEGVAAVESAHPEVPVFAAVIDRCLNEQGYILPGLGDAGDRVCSTQILG